MEHSPSCEVTVTQLVKKLPTLMEPEGSLLCSQEHTPVPYPESSASSPQLLTLFL